MLKLFTRPSETNGYLVHGSRVKPPGYEGTEWMNCSDADYLRMHQEARTSRSERMQPPGAEGTEYLEWSDDEYRAAIEDGKARNRFSLAGLLSSPSEKNGFLKNGERVKPPGHEGTEWMEVSDAEYQAMHRSARKLPWLNLRTAKGSDE